MSAARTRSVVAVMLLSTFAIGVSSCAGASKPAISTSEEEGPVDLEIAARFPAKWLSRIDYAIAAFQKTGQGVECFTVTIGRDEAVNLDFVSVSPTINLTAAGGFGRVDGCGIGVAYYFDDSGEFLRSEIQK